jgi:hypothetical protein
MKPNSSSIEGDGAVGAPVFLPKRGSVWMPIVTGLFLAGVGVLLLLLPLLTGLASAGVGVMVYALAVFMLVVGAWLIRLGALVRRFQVTVTPDTLEVCAWGLAWWPRSRNARRAVLKWDQVRGIHLRERENAFAPGGKVRAFLLETEVGPFFFSNVEWHEPERLAELICERIQQLLGELPPQVLGEVEARQQAADRSLPARAMRVGGVCFMVLGWILLVLIVLSMLVARGEDRVSIAKALLLIPIIFLGARAMRRFRAL